MTWDWVPLRRVGPFEFGQPVKRYVDRFDLIYLPEEDVPSVGWDSYAVPTVDVRIHAENGVVVAVACYEHCTLHGRELIGLDFEDACVALGAKPSRKPDVIDMGVSVQEVYEFDDLEAQFWVKDGKVVTVICSARCDG